MFDDIRNYFQKVWQLEDKFRVIVILVIAVVVLFLLLFDGAMHVTAAHENGASSMDMTMHM